MFMKIKSYLKGCMKTSVEKVLKCIGHLRVEGPFRLEGFTHILEGFTHLLEGFTHVFEGFTDN